MCGEGVNWPDIPEPEYRREFDVHPREMEMIFNLGLSGIPHSYPKDRSIGHLILERQEATDDDA